MNPDEAARKLFKWASDINIGYIIDSHYFIVGELRRKEDEFNQAIPNFRGDRKEEIELRVERDRYASTYKQHLMSTTFLILYSHLEEWLFLIEKQYAKSLKLNTKSRGSISRFAPVIKHALQFDVSRDETLRFLFEAEKVRNCLLHANARIDLSRDAQELRKLVSKGNLFQIHSRLYVDQGYLKKFFECIQNIISHVAVSSQDKIDDRN